MGGCEFSGVPVGLERFCRNFPSLKGWFDWQMSDVYGVVLRADAAAAQIAAAGQARAPVPT